MAWRGLHIGRPSRLSLKAQRLVVEQEDDEPVSFPLEDVAWVVLDTPQVTASAALMAACVQAAIPVVFSDGKHIPCGVLLPFHQHWQQAGVARAQIAAGTPLKKRLWQAIVRRKIENQAAVLDWAQVEGGRTLREMTPRVRSGDPDNVEARGARFYWQPPVRRFSPPRSRRSARNTLCSTTPTPCSARGGGAGVGRGRFVARFRRPSRQYRRTRSTWPTTCWRCCGRWPIGRPVRRCPARVAEGRAEADLTREQRQQLVGVMTETVVIEGEADERCCRRSTAWSRRWSAPCRAQERRRAGPAEGCEADHARGGGPVHVSVRVLRPAGEDQERAAQRDPVPQLSWSPTAIDMMQYLGLYAGVPGPGRGRTSTSARMEKKPAAEGQRARLCKSPTTNSPA